LNAIALVAKRTVTVDTVMTSLSSEGSGQGCKIIEGFVDWYKSVAGVDEVSIGNARCAEVPVRAVKALVTNTVNVLITSITDSIVANVTTRSEQSLGDEIKLGLLNSRFECMLGVVAMLHANVARDAEIKVGARSAGDEVLLGKFLNARIASASSNRNLQVLGDARCSLWL
jgi:hypothetical protein